MSKRKIADTMSKLLVKILDDVMQEFRGKDPNIFLAELLFFGVLDKDEGSLVDGKDLHTRKFVEIFSLLKPKQEDIVLPALQKICIKLKWRSALQLIQSRLKSSKMEQFIVPVEELQKDHKIFKHAIPTMQLLFVGRNGYLTKIHDLIENYKATDANNMSKLIKIAVTGLGGIGKTQLVIQFVVKYQLEYDSIIWINAESYNTSVTSFTNLGQKLGIFNEKVDIRTNVEAIYGMLSRQYSRNLLIFDNADDYIPSEFWFDKLENFIVIITSRNREWPFFKIDIDVFQHNEAVEFVKKSLSEENYDSDGAIGNLINELQFFPLALQQAVAYIKQSHEEEKIFSNRFTIIDYLRAYVTHRKALLNFLLRLENNKVNFVTTLNTWSVTFTKLSLLVYPGVYNAEDFPETLPLQILNLTSFLDGEQIDPTYFLTVAKNNKQHLGWSILKLDQYSMVNKVSVGEHQKRQLIKIHKLIQDITRIQMQEKHQELQVFEVVCCIMDSQSPGEQDSLEDLTKFKELLPHFASLNKAMDMLPCMGEKLYIRKRVLCNLQICCSHFGNYILQKDCLLEILLIEQRQHGYSAKCFGTLLSIMGEVILKLGHPKTATLLLERSLVFQAQYANPFKTVATLARLSRACGELRNFNKQKEYLDKCINIRKSYPGSSVSYQQVANIALSSGDTQTKKKLLEESLQIAKQCYGTEHPRIALLLGHLAATYGELGNHKEKLTLLHDAKKIQETYYGLDSIEIAGTFLGIADALGKLGDPKSKQIFTERALKIREAHFHLSH